MLDFIPHKAFQGRHKRRKWRHVRKTTFHWVTLLKSDSDLLPLKINFQYCGLHLRAAYNIIFTVRINLLRFELHLNTILQIMTTYSYPCNLSYSSNSQNRFSRPLPRSVCLPASMRNRMNTAWPPFSSLSSARKKSIFFLYIQVYSKFQRYFRKH